MNLTKRQMILLAMLVQVAALYGYYRYHQSKTEWLHTPHAATKIITKVDVENFPDLGVEIRFKVAPSEQLIKRLSEYKTQYAIRHNAYLSEISCEEDEHVYHMMCDFQALTYDDMAIRELIRGLSDMEGMEIADSLIIQ